MTERGRRGSGFTVGLALLAVVAVSGFGFLLTRAQALPTGVVPIAWDKEACAYCRMHVGEQGFAAQLQLTDGRILNFDDPGCMLTWLETNASPVHATWVHHRTDDRWLSREQVAFVEASPTPMGFGLAAVDASVPRAMGWDQAAAQLRIRKKGGAR